MVAIGIIEKSTDEACKKWGKLLYKDQNGSRRIKKG
jgi:hypothetical protein